MKGFSSTDTIDAASLPDGLAAVARSALAGRIATCTQSGREYDPEEDGFVALIEKSDNPIRQRGELGFTLEEAAFAAVSLESGYFIGTVHLDHRFTVILVIPDEPWLDPHLRHTLTALACGKIADE
jgi:hypothetical protein